MQRAGLLAVWLALIAASALVVVLANQNRLLRKQIMRLKVQDQTLHAGLVVPPFHAVTLAGDSITIGQAPTGSRQVLFVFTTTCGFCLQAIPAWSAIARRASALRSPRTAVYGISLDPESATTAYASAHSLRYPVLRFPDEKTAALYRARAVPVTAALDGDGNVLYGRAGVPSAGAVDTLFSVLTRPVSGAGRRDSSSSTRRQP